MSSSRGASLYDRALRALGWIAFTGALGVALHDASLAYDSWYYHLPFAARLAGVIPARSYVFHAANQARYEGFALLAELLQGSLWRVTGRAESANLVALSSLPLLAWFMQRRWKVPFPLTLLGLLAVPLIETHAPSCYVDLPGNAAASVLVLLVIDAYASDVPVPPSDVALALLTGAIAANIKPLLQPVVGLALLTILVRLTRERRTRPLALVMIFASPLVLFTPLKNLVVHGNPFYPIGTHIFGVTLPGPEEPYASSPAWLAHWPRPARFVASLLEMHVRPLDDPHRWTVDQWMPDETGGNRMGGFFAGYVVCSVAAFVVRMADGAPRLGRVSGIVFACLTALIACMPQSHELRYYLSWMIVLVCLNLGLACRASREKSMLTLRRLATLAALSFAVVVLSTRGVYAYPHGMGVKDLVASRVSDRVLDEVKEGGEVCVAKEPFVLLWAEQFHRPRRYTVHEAEEARDCGGVTEARAE